MNDTTKQCYRPGRYSRVGPVVLDRRRSALGHLQPSCSIAFDFSLPSVTFRASGCSVTEALGRLCRFACVGTGGSFLTNVRRHWFPAWTWYARMLRLRCGIKVLKCLEIEYEDQRTRDRRSKRRSRPQQQSLRNPLPRDRLFQTPKSWSLCASIGTCFNISKNPGLAGRTGSMKR